MPPATQLVTLQVEWTFILGELGLSPPDLILARSREVTEMVTAKDSGPAAVPKMSCSLDRSHKDGRGTPSPKAGVILTVLVLCLGLGEVSLCEASKACFFTPGFAVLPAL